jgi:polyhydroxyalkanoate synthesis regulator phasin
MAEQRRRAGPKRSGGGRKPSGKNRSEKPGGGSAPPRSRGEGSHEQGPRDLSTKSVAELRDALSKRLIDPLGVVMLSRERIEEALGDAVSRGRVTADDAQDLAASLLERGRKQTNDLLSDLEQLLGRSREEIEEGAKRARKQVEGAKGRARKQAGPVIARADKARRASGLRTSFPIIGYEDLTVAEVERRLDGLTAAELRKVRDHERRHANRKTVLTAITARLA